MVGLARLLECLLWPARKEEEAEEKEEKEEGRRAPYRPRSLLDAPRCAQSAAQGWRTHITLGSHYLGCPPRWAFSAVLEDHGGARASLFGARHLPGHVLEALGPAPGEPQGVCRALRLAFLSADARLRSLWPHREPGGSTAALLIFPSFLYQAPWRSAPRTAGPSGLRDASASMTWAAASAAGAWRTLWQC